MKTPSPLLALAVLAFLPAASAHVQVETVGPTAPIPVGQPTEITVTLSALCPVVVAEYAQKPALDLALVSTADGVEPPSYLPFVGETVPFTVSECGLDGYAHTTGIVTVTPSALAPAFQDIPVQPGAVGETNEGGNLTLQVAYAWSAKLVSANLTAGGNGTLVLDVTANHDTILKLSSDDLDVPAEVEVVSPLLAGNATRRIEIPARAHDAGNATFTVSAVAKGKPATGSPFALAATVLPAPATTTEVDEHDQHEHADEKNASAPAFALVGVVLLALALRRR